MQAERRQQPEGRVTPSSPPHLTNAPRLLPQTDTPGSHLPKAAPDMSLAVAAPSAEEKDAQDTTALAEEGGRLATAAAAKPQAPWRQHTFDRSNNEGVLVEHHLPFPFYRPVHGRVTEPHDWQGTCGVTWWLLGGRLSLPSR